MVPRIVRGALVASLALVLAACGADGQASSRSSSDPSDAAGVVEEGVATEAGAAEEAPGSSSASSSDEVANPIEDFKTLGDASANAGIDLVAPESALGLDATAYECIRGQFVQVVYGDGELMVRKGADEGDVSGDYNDYDSTDSIVVNGTTITCKGNGGTISLASWVSNGHFVCISDAKGLTFDDVYAVYSQVG